MALTTGTALAHADLPAATAAIDHADNKAQILAAIGGMPDNRTPQALSGHGALAAVNLTTLTTTIVNDGTANTTTTLADGTSGQVKQICLLTKSTYDAVITVAHAIWGDGGTITLGTAGESITLCFLGSKWQVMSNNGAVLETA